MIRINICFMWAVCHFVPLVSYQDWRDIAPSLFWGVYVACSGVYIVCLFEMLGVTPKDQLATTLHAALVCMGSLLVICPIAIPALVNVFYTVPGGIEGVGLAILVAQVVVVPTAVWYCSRNRPLPERVHSWNATLLLCPYSAPMLFLIRAAGFLR